MKTQGDILRAAPPSPADHGRFTLMQLRLPVSLSSGSAIRRKVGTTSILFVATLAAALSGLFSTAQAQTPPPFQVTVTAESHADMSIVGIQSPITLSGTVTSSTPTAVILDVLLDGPPPPSTFLPSGGAWQIILDTTSLVTIAQTPGYVLTNSSGLTTFGIVAADASGFFVSYSTRYFGDFTSILAADFGPSFSEFDSAVDLSAAVHLYVDYIPPVVTFDASTPLPTLSGLVTDNFQLGTLTLSIQDIGNPALPGVNQAAIQIETGLGAISSTWTYTGFTGWKPGDSYLITAIAVDSVMNASTWASTITIPSAIEASLPTVTPAQSTDQMTFDNAPFVVQYNPGTPVTFCGHMTENPGEQYIYTADSLNRFVTASVNIETQPGCTVNIQIVANVNACQPQDTVRVYRNYQQVGQLPVSILIPTSQMYAPDTSFSDLPEYVGKNYYGLGVPIFDLYDHVIVTMTGASQMDLSGDFGEEHLEHHPFVQNYVPYPSCGSPSVAFPPFSLTSSPIKNQFRDKYGYGNVPLVTGKFGTLSIACGDVEYQYYGVYACAVPSLPTIIDVQTYIVAPNSLRLLRNGITP